MVFLMIQHGDSKKVCNYDNAAPSAIPRTDSSSWTVCGNADHSCNDLASGEMTWVRVVMMTIII